MFKRSFAQFPTEFRSGVVRAKSGDKSLARRAWLGAHRTVKAQIAAF
jgi:hypothetical protein